MKASDRPMAGLADGRWPKPMLKPMHLSVYNTKERIVMKSVAYKHLPTFNKQTILNRAQ